MPIDIHHHRKEIGKYLPEQRKYKHSKLTQKILNKISDSQQSKHVNNPYFSATILCTSIICSLQFVENKPESPPKKSINKNNKVANNNKIRKSTLSQSINENECDSLYLDIPIIVINGLSRIQNIIKQYDFLKFPEANAKKHHDKHRIIDNIHDVDLIMIPEISDIIWDEKRNRFFSDYIGHLKVLNKEVPVNIIKYYKATDYHILSPLNEKNTVGTITTPKYAIYNNSQIESAMNIVINSIDLKGEKSEFFIKKYNMVISDVVNNNLPNEARYIDVLKGYIDFLQNEINNPKSFVYEKDLLSTTQNCLYKFWDISDNLSNSVLRNEIESFQKESDNQYIFDSDNRCMDVLSSIILGGSENPERIVFRDIYHEVIRELGSYVNDSEMDMIVNFLSLMIKELNKQIYQEDSLVNKNNLNLDALIIIYNYWRCFESLDEHTMMEVYVTFDDPIFTLSNNYILGEIDNISWGDRSADYNGELFSIKIEAENRGRIISEIPVYEKRNALIERLVNYVKALKVELENDESKVNVENLDRVAELQYYQLWNIVNRLVDEEDLPQVNYFKDELKETSDWVINVNPNNKYFKKISYNLNDEIKKLIFSLPIDEDKTKLIHHLIENAEKLTRESKNIIKRKYDLLLLVNIIDVLDSEITERGKTYQEKSIYGVLKKILNDCYVLICSLTDEYDIWFIKKNKINLAGCDFVKKNQVEKFIFSILYDMSFDNNFRSELDRIYFLSDTAENVRNAETIEDRNENLLVNIMGIITYSDYLKDESSWVYHDGDRIDNHWYSSIWKWFADELWGRTGKSNKGAIAHKITNEGVRQNYTSVQLYNENKIDSTKKFNINLNYIDNADNVKDLSKTLDCQRLNYPNILRVVARVLRNPITEIPNVIYIIKHHAIDGEECLKIDLTVKSIANKVEDIIVQIASFILNLIPVTAPVGKLVDGIVIGRSAVATILEIEADAIESKNVSKENMAEINQDVVALTKNLVNSVIGKHINSADSLKGNMKKTSDEISSEINGEIDLALSSFSIKNNKLVAKVKDKPQPSEVLVTPDFIIEKISNKIFHYDGKKVSALEQYVSNSFSVINKKYPQFSHNLNIKKERNSVYFESNGASFVIMDGKILNIEKQKIKEDVYKYYTYESDSLDNKINIKPIIFKYNNWVYEPDTLSSVSAELNSQFSQNEKFKSILVSTKISESDIGPIVFGNKFRYDADFNRYIKINGNYYNIETDFLGRNYINGDEYIYPIKIRDEMIYPLENKYEGIFNLRSEEVDFIKNEVKSNKEDIYIDNSIIIELGKNNDYFINSPNQLNEEYIYLHNRYLHLKEVGGGHYLLVKPNGQESDFSIYKHDDSNTFYLVEDFKKSEKNYLVNFCRLNKRDGGSACLNVGETPELGNLFTLNENGSKYAFDTLKDLPEGTTQFKGYSNIYTYKENNINKYLYKKDRKYYHATLSTGSIKNNGAIPIFMRIYGSKSGSSQIDKNFLISKVSLIKDIKSNRLTLATQEQAHRIVFNFSEDNIKSLGKLRAGMETIDYDSERNRIRFENTAENINNKQRVEKLYLTGNKQMVAPKYQNPQYQTRNENELKAEFFPDKNDNIQTIFLNSIRDASLVNGNSFVFGHLEAMHNCVLARNTIKNNINSAITMLFEKVGYTNRDAATVFIENMDYRIRKIREIYSDRINIAIFSRQDNYSDAYLSKLILGATNIGDIDKKIYLSAQAINFSHEYLAKNLARNLGNGVVVPKKNIYRNIVSETIIHEGSHNLFGTNDGIYLEMSNYGKIVELQQSFNDFVLSITQPYQEIPVDIKYILKMYFSSNNIYNDYSLDSLLEPDNLRYLVRADDYLKGLLMLHNADFTALMVSELAGLSPPQPILPISN